jgi:hypothetical protein
MKRTTPLLLAAVLLATAAPALPCEIHFAQAKMTAAVGREAQAVVTVVLEHRNCRIPMEQTAIEGKGLTIVKQGAWQRVKADTYSLDITFILNGPKGELRVSRECDKKGVSEGVLKVTGL